MNDIKEAVRFLNNHVRDCEKGECKECDNIRTLLSLAEKYLQASEVMPSGDDVTSEWEDGYNSAIDACTFSLMKKCEGLEEVIEKLLCEEYELMSKNCVSDLVGISTRLQEYLMGRVK